MTNAVSLVSALPVLSSHADLAQPAAFSRKTGRASSGTSLPPQRPAGSGVLVPRARLQLPQQEPLGFQATALKKLDRVIGSLGLGNPHIIRQAIPLETFDLAAAAAEELRSRLGASDPGAGSVQRIARQRALLECMRVFAAQSYFSARQGLTDVGRFRPMAGLCTGVMKVWSAETPEGLNLVVAMAGTRFSLKDVSLDLSSQLVGPHVNPLDASLPALEAVGKGWSARWAEQAHARRPGWQSLGETLAACARQSVQDGKPMQVMLTGHSMGGAVATLAGYDIAHFLAQQGVAGMTSVYAFNPPRLGAQASQAAYQRALAGHPQAGKSAAPALALRQLTREFDAVQSVPVRQSHPLWHAPGKPAVAGTYHAPGMGARALDPLLNHDLKEWQHEIATMPNRQLARLFETQ